MNIDNLKEIYDRYFIQKLSCLFYFYTILIIFQEFIESEGLAMILSKDYGLVLFHLGSVWIGDTQIDMQNTR